ncbi:MAG: DUF4956 domain-containing protein [Anaerolineales bacterium]|jgi:hypothetical protein
MKRQTHIWRGLWISIFLVLALVLPASAQEGGFSEDFEDSSLEGWEHSPDVIVVDGKLRMSGGESAFRVGEWFDFTLTLRLVAESPGDVMVHYHAREESRYLLHLLPDEIILERHGPEGGELLGAAPLEGISTASWVELVLHVAGGEHEISIEEQVVLTATDPQPLSPGAVGFVYHGEGYAEVDDVALALQGWPEDASEPGGITGEPGEPEGEAHVPAEELAPDAVPTTEPDERGIGGFINDLLSGQAQPAEMTTFMINLLLSALFAFILGRVYIFWGTSLSNRRALAGNFMLITITTTFIILVVRSSVALSLGLVGALSIVRFRAAIKEPEELAYLFFAIGIGIGLGDNQRLITLIALVVGILLIGLVKLLHSRQADMNLHITVASANPGATTLEQVMEILSANTTRLKLLRFDETDSALESTFLVEFEGLENMNRARKNLRELSPGIEITFLDNRGIE